MFYVEINNGKITGKGQISIDVNLANNQEEITEDIYNIITRMPAEFKINEDKSVSVINAPELETQTKSFQESAPTIESIEQKINELLAQLNQLKSETA